MRASAHGRCVFTLPLGLLLAVLPAVLPAACSAVQAAPASPFRAALARIPRDATTEAKIAAYREALAAWLPSDGEPGLAAARRNLAIQLAAKAWEPFARVRDKPTALANLGRNEALCLEAVSLWPEYANAWRILGYTYFRAGFLDRCVPFFERALASPNPPADTHLFLAQALEALGRRQESVRLLAPYVAKGGDSLAERLYFLDLRTLAHEAFAAKDYGLAAARYRECRDLLRFAELRKLDDGSRGTIAEHIAMAEKLKALGPFEPRVVYRVLALTIERVDASLVDLRGREVRYRSDAPDPLTLPWRGLCQEYLARCVEAWSGGAMTVAFEERRIDAAITDFRLNWMGLDPSSGLEMHVADLASVSPPLAPLLHETRNVYDSYIVYYDGEGGAGAGFHGRLARLPYPGGRTAGVFRGTLDIPLNDLAQPEGPSILVHEFFHNLEGLVGIKPEHGWFPAVRSAFPEWTGTTEYDYYRWRFETTLPLFGWERVRFVSRWPDPE